MSGDARAEFATPDRTLDRGDPGDDTQRRFRYQAAFAAILALDLIDSEGDTEEIFCEHHEDVLLRLRRGQLVGVAIKSRAPGKSPFKTGDAEILTALARFARHELEFPASFSRYTLVASSGFWHERKNGSNLVFIVERIRQEPAGPLAKQLSRRIAKLNRWSPADDDSSPQMWATASMLAKLGLHDGPAVPDIENRLVGLLAALPAMKRRALDDARRAAERLIDGTQAAGSLSHQARLRDYILVREPNERTRAGIDAKRITRQQVQSILGINSTTEDVEARAAAPDRIERLSHARCIALWQAAGVPRAEAVALANTEDIGDRSAALPLERANSLVLLLGDIGSGKSLQLERLLQKAIRRLRTQTGAPFPVYVDATQLNQSLLDWAARALEAAALPSTYPTTMYIDRTDEAGTVVATDLIHQARVYVAAKQDASIVMASRPLPGFAKHEEAVVLPPLGEQESTALITRFAQRELPLGVRYAWPSELKEAIRSPLFAVLLGLQLRFEDYRAPISRGTLVTRLVERFLGDPLIDRIGADPLLSRLAVMSIERAGAAVDTAELGTRPQLAQLLNSGIIAEEPPARVRFPLRVIADWFAAQTLENGLPAGVAESPKRLEYWTGALVIACSSLAYAAVSSVLSSLVVHDPGLAAVVIEESLNRWGVGASERPPSAEMAGAQVRSAMQQWVRGLGPLAHLIAPVRDDGTVRPIGVTASPNWLYTSWYYGTQAVDPIVTRQSAEADGEWPRVIGAHPGSQTAWAWRWSLEDLRGVLKEKIDAEALPPVPSLQPELTWRAALAVLNRGSLEPGPLNVAHLQRALAPVQDERTFIRTLHGLVSLRPLLAEVRRLAGMNEQWLHCPWPAPDLEDRRGGWVWNPYSTDRIRGRTEAVFHQALQAYREIVERWFAPLRWRFRYGALLPARLVGRMLPSRNDRGPVLSWYLEPLSSSASNLTEIAVADSEYEITDLEPLVKLIRTLRPSAVSVWPMLQGQVLEVFDDRPVSRLVYRWLESDLRAIKWLP